MKRYFALMAKTAVISAWVVFSGFLASEALALEPPIPPPPAAPAGGDFTIALVIASIAAFGAWKLIKRK